MAAVVSDNMRKMAYDRAVGNPGLAADLAFLQVSKQSSNGGDKVRLSLAGWHVGAWSIQRHWSPP